MARKPKSVTDINREIDALRAQRAAALDARAAQIGKIAAKADLILLDIPDAELLAAFKAMAKRFRDTPATARPIAPNAPGPSGT